MNADIVEALLLDWNEKNDPPMPVREVRTTMKSIERSHVGLETQFTSIEFDDDTPNSEKQNNTFIL